MSSGPRTCAAGLKAIDKTKIGQNRSSATREIMTCTTHTTISPHRVVPQREPGTLGDQVILTQFEEGDLASQLQTIGD
jgi:hypothetical protein